MQIIHQANNTYLARANIKIINGATLQVIGSTVGGDTDELRLMSDVNSSTPAYSTIIADWGNLIISHTQVHSWDEVASAPSTSTKYGRAYIDVRSRYINGIAFESHMDVVGSDVGYLGFDGAESYGLVWKVEGSTSTDKSVFDYANVLGDVVDSHLHNNWFGMYTYGAFGMHISNNEADHNTKYGIDMHDDSDYLTITNNQTHDNGDHGIICSQRCDHLTITGNTSYNNVGHGIMLHRSTDYCDIEDNLVYNNTGAGIALFESNNNTVRKNTLVGNAYGIRLSVGSSYNTFIDNTITGSTSYGIYTYKGSDLPERPGNNGINSYNSWEGNTISTTKRKVLDLTATDHDSYDSNDFRNNPGAGYYTSGATNTTFTNNLVDPGVILLSS